MYVRLVGKGHIKILLGLFLQMLMNAMETIGANMAARTSWEVTDVVVLKDIFSITSGISVLVSHMASHLKASLRQMNK